jgi:acyl carrier protein phosphodiesterase
MNFLAHLYLSENNTNIMIVNFITDLTQEGEQVTMLIMQ